MATKNIVLCFDGTWNTPGESAKKGEDDSTNVSRFYERVKTATPAAPQEKWYNEGVGTEWMNRVRGGTAGLGLDKHIKDGYRQLIEMYREGDTIYIVGFSRGAYTARSLVGLIRNCGLLQRANPKLIDRAYAIYRSRDGVDSDEANAFRTANSLDIKIRFLGVWDTVGALGIPLRSLKGINLENYSFHDMRLSSIVEYGFQALALDEHRQPYEASLWGPQDAKDRALGQTIDQVWFPGAHADVGGGYSDKGEITDLTLSWMLERAASCGLDVVPLQSPASTIGAVIHDSYAQFLRGLFSRFSSRYYRVVGKAEDGVQSAHVSASGSGPLDCCFSLSRPHKRTQRQAGPYPRRN